MTAPTPNRGMQGEGLSLVAEAKRMIEKSIKMPGMGAETDIGQANLKWLAAIGKVLPEGTVTPGMRDAGMQQWMMQGRRENPMAAIIAALQGGGGAGGAPGGAPAAAPAPPPGGADLPAAA
jgi:hypothetical protein